MIEHDQNAQASLKALIVGYLILMWHQSPQAAMAAAIRMRQRYPWFSSA